MKNGFALVACALLLPLAVGCTKPYKERIASQDREISKLRIELAESAEELIDVEGTVAGLRSDRDRLEERAGALEARLATMVEYARQLEAEIERLGGDKAKMAGKYQEALAEQQRLIDEMKKKQAQAQARLETLKGMLAKFKALIAGGKLNVRIRDGKLMLELPSAVLFDSGKADVREDGLATLAEVAAVLSQIPDREFQVAGHTDDVPISSGRFEDNWALSTARSVAVVRELQRRGVKPVGLSASGYSEFRPAVPNTGKDNRAQNRRIEIILMPNLDELPDMSELERELN
jgi:chemotaxis protein MotB